MWLNELSFFKHNLSIHEQTLNISSLLWPELYINQCSHIIIIEVHTYLISTVHRFQFLDCNKWNWNNLFTISEIYHKYYRIYTRVL